MVKSSFRISKKCEKPLRGEAVTIACVLGALSSQPRSGKRKITEESRESAGCCYLLNQKDVYLFQILCIYLPSSNLEFNARTNQHLLFVQLINQELYQRECLSL